TGEVHHAVLEDNKNYDLVKDNPSLQTWRTAALGTNVININHRKEPLSKQRVRQAMSMAIDRDEILQAAGSGFGQVSGPIPSSHPTWTVPIANLPFYKPDPDGARAALADAGYPNGFDMDVIYIPQFPLMDISAQVLAAQWQKIGINAARAPPNTASGWTCESRRSTTGSAPIWTSRHSTRINICSIRSTPAARRPVGMVGATRTSMRCWTRA